MKYILKKTFFLLFAIIIVAGACEKEAPPCNGNCYNVNIKGKVYNKTTNQGFANIPVEVSWHRGGSCIGCTIYKVAEGTTDANGNFNLTKGIDTSFFKDHFLKVSIPSDTSYFINLLEAENGFFAKRFYDFNALQLQQINFELYPKVPLTIKLRRTQQDNFGYYTIGHSFATNLPGSYYEFNNSLAVVDTIIHQQTAPGIYTRIVWRKGFVAGPFTEGSDSLICTPGGNNTIEVNF